MPRTHNITLGMALVSMLVLFTSELGAYTVTATAWTSGGTSTTTGGTGSTGSGTGTGGGTIVPDPLVLESTSLDDAYVNEDYSMELALSGGTAPYTFSATGLPSGLSIDPDTGDISGTVTYPESASVQITVDDAGSDSDSVTLALEVLARDLVLTTSGLNFAVSGESYFAQLDATGGVAPLAWVVTGLPASLSVSVSGAISGLPSESDIGNYIVEVTVEDANAPQDFAINRFSLMVAEAEDLPLEIQQTSLALGYSNVSYTATTLTASEDVDSWDVLGLPGGMLSTKSGSASLSISGTPAIAGVYTVQVVATKADGEQASRMFPLVVSQSSSSSSSSGVTVLGGSADLTGSAGCSLSAGDSPWGILLGLLALVAGAVVTRRSNKLVCVKNN